MFRRLIFASVVVPIAAIAVMTEGQELPAPVAPPPVVIGETPETPVPVPAPPELIENPAPQPGDTTSSSTVVSPQRRVSLGIVAEEQPDQNGLVVLSVRSGSPAERAGIRVGDVLTGLDGRVTNTIEDVSGALLNVSAGQTIAVEVARGTQIFELRATMASVAPPSVDDVPRQPPSEAPPVTASGKGILGVVVEDARSTLGRLPIVRGARVVNLAPGAPAETTGLRVGDIIVSIDGRVMYGSRELISYMQSTRAGQTVEVGYYRDGNMARTAIVLGGASGAGSTAPPTNPPGVIIGRPPSVGDILDNVERTIDGFLRGRPAGHPMQATPPVGPYPSTGTPAPPNVAPIETPGPTETSVVGDSAEVIQLRQQVEQLLNRVRTLENQLHKQQSDTKSSESL